MIARLPLRWRVAIAYGLIGFLLSLAFAVATSIVAEDYEHLIIETLLVGEYKDYSERLRREPGLALPRTPGYSVYRDAEAPLPFRHLSDGVHEPDVDGHEGLHVAAFGPPSQRLVFVMELGGIEQREDYLAHLMVMVVLGGTLISGWLGWVLSRRTVAPVMRLAQAVDALPTRPAATRLADRLGQDEIGRLAGAIDAYQQRLVDSDAKERAFFADASHELRTPIAVVQGAVEVLLDDPEAAPAQRLRMARVERGVQDLSALLEALLLSARGLPSRLDGIDLAAHCRDAVARLQVQDHVAVEGTGPTSLQAPSRWVDAILAVLVLRARAFAPAAHWVLRLDGEGLRLQRRDAAPDEANAPGRSDLGLGLIFVERLCRGLGWRLVQETGTHGLQVRLQVGDADGPAG